TFMRRTVLGPSTRRASTHRDLGRWRSRGKGGHLGGETILPGPQPRMILAPAPLEAEVAIAERAGERDLADVGRRVETGRRGFERGRRARHLAALMIEPFRLVLVGGPITGLVIDQDRGLHQPIPKRLEPQRREPRRRLLRDDAAAARQMVE